MNGWLLLSLLTAHVIGDFYLQSDKYCKQKDLMNFKSSFLYIHSVTVGLLSWAFVPFANFGFFAMIIGITHLLIDAMKTYMCRGLLSFLIDQFAHILILCLISCLYIPASRLLIQNADILNALSIPLFSFAILCCLKPTNIFIKLILDKYKIGSTDSCKSIKNAGALIGNLERILAMVFVLIGQFEAVGFIIAAKSLLRYKDSDTEKTEYVLAGTLLSFGMAILCGLLVRYNAFYYLL